MLTNNNPTRWLLVLLINILTLLWIFPARAQEPAQVWLDLTTTTIAPGETFDLGVEIAGVTGLFGAEVALTFDPTQLQVVDVADNRNGVQISPGAIPDPQQGFIAVNRADNAVGTVLYALTLLAPAPPVEGAGRLATVTFRAVGVGNAEISVQQIQLLAQDGIPVAFDLLAPALTINIADQQSDTPTAQRATLDYPTTTLLSIPDTLNPTSIPQESHLDSPHTPPVWAIWLCAGILLSLWGGRKIITWLRQHYP